MEHVVFPCTCLPTWPHLTLFAVGIARDAQGRKAITLAESYLLTDAKKSTKNVVCIFVCFKKIVETLFRWIMGIIYCKFGHFQNFHPNKIFYKCMYIIRFCVATNSFYDNDQFVQH